MKVYILVGYIPYSVDNEVENLGVYTSKKKAEKGWDKYCKETGYLEDHRIEEWEVE